MPVYEVLRGACEVEAVGNAEQAWAAAQRQTPDLVLCDVVMPGPDGIELTRWLRADARTATVPTILITDDYLQKPLARPSCWLGWALIAN